MTPLGDILRGMEAWRAHIGPMAAEHAKRQAEVEARAWVVLRETGCARDAALRVALFSLGGWAQRFPDKSYDLGERAALFIAEWCAARAVFPSDDRMHAALVEWRAREMVRRAGLPTVSPLPKDVIDAIVSAGGAATAAAKRLAAEMAAGAPRPQNRHEMRRARSRRWRG